MFIKYFYHWLKNPKLRNPHIAYHYNDIVIRRLTMLYGFEYFSYYGEWTVSLLASSKLESIEDAERWLKSINRHGTIITN